VSAGNKARCSFLSHQPNPGSVRSLATGVPYNAIKTPYGGVMSLVNHILHTLMSICEILPDLLHWVLSYDGVLRTKTALAYELHSRI
jgi:hypothetical protein